MNPVKIIIVLFILITAIFFAGSCKTEDINNITAAERQPVIEPDYSGVTIPPNIAPMNFIISEEGRYFKILAESSNGTSLTLGSNNGIVRFPLKSWKKLMQNSNGGDIKIEIIAEGAEKAFRKFEPLYFHVSNEPIDPYLCYRLLYPGYRSWVEMKLVQRCIENFEETSFFENQLLDNNCVNCHTFRNNDPEKFLIHVRGSKGGTYFVEGDKIGKAALKTDNMPTNVVYPAWNPMGRYLAFSSNKTVQSFHMRPEKNIEVYDLSSSLVIYDEEKNEINGLKDKDTVAYMETFPAWSPDGKYLYYCRTRQLKRESDYMEVRYDLIRKSFDPLTGLTGESEIVFDAQSMEKSVSLPSVSPDGKYVVFALHDYGTFSIWHKEADLYIFNLESKVAERMSLNSEDTESYHRWSSEGRWIVFSSKRLDGLTARPFFAYFDPSGKTGKPFVLPQQDPALYRRMEKTFNRPELITGKILVGPRDFAEESGKVPLKAKWVDK